MKIQATASQFTAKSSSDFFKSLADGNVEKIGVPIARNEELSTIEAQLLKELPGDHIHALEKSTISVNIVFDSYEEAQLALSKFYARVPSKAEITSDSLRSSPPVLREPMFTVKQGLEGGAVIGGIGGAGIVTLLQGLRSTSDAFGDPVLSTLGSIFIGMSIGAASGGIVAKTDVFRLIVKKDSIEITASPIQPSSKTS